ncbi:Uncharacterized protein Fot_17137 [Forsythia ovata]|uniref:Uncharacterized protein n=1 Tax=Forsythia ovata TaxID=205694 RepID=A0ABD1VET8_9LAMI
MRNQIIAQAEDSNHWSSWLTLTWLKMGHMMTSQHLCRSLSLSGAKKSRSSKIVIARSLKQGRSGEEVVVVVGTVALKEKENRDLMAAVAPGIEGRQDEEGVKEED